MIYVTAEQMRQIDHYTIKEIGIPSIVLMENAKAQISKHILDKNFDKAYVFASVGNNGGDGLAVARDIYNQERFVKVYVIGKLEKASTDFKINYDILKKLDVEIEFVDENTKFDITENDLIVDSIFGTGLKRDIEGIYKDVIDMINDTQAFVVSVDMPSGLDSDENKIHNVAVKADLLVTLQLPKKSLQDYEGEYVVETIGIPEKSIKHVLNNAS